MIPLTRPLTGDEEIQLVAEVLRSGWLTQGPKTAAFEEAIARVVGAPHVVAVSSCTTALHLAVLLAGVQPGDEVIVPSYTFVATANAVLYAGAVPVFAEIDAKTFTLAPSEIERLVTSRTRAVIAVDQFGLPAELDALEEACRARGLVFLEDAACALGAAYRGRPIGSRGKFVLFSFHPRKSITTGEGGALVTDDPAVDARARILRSHGASLSDAARHGAMGKAFESYVDLGYNYRLSDLQAAVGLAQVKRLDGILARRRALAARYAERLAGLPWIEPPFEPPHARHPYQTYAALLRPGAPIDRDSLIRHLADCGVSSRRGIPPIHREPYMEARLKAPVTLPVTEDISRRTLILPLYPQMTEAEQEQVVEALRSAPSSRAR